MSRSSRCLAPIVGNFVMCRKVVHNCEDILILYYLWNFRPVSINKLLSQFGPVFMYSQIEVATFGIGTKDKRIGMYNGSRTKGK